MSQYQERTWAADELFEAGKVFVRPGDFDSGNPEPRSLVILLSDFSYSMERFSEEVRRALCDFYLEMERNTAARRCVEVGLIAFSTEILVQDFAPPTWLLKHGRPKRPQTGMTNLGQSLGVAMDMFEHRLKLLSDHNGVQRKPILLTVTDGEGNDPMGAALERLHAAQQDGLGVMSIAVSPGHKMKLARLFGGRPFDLEEFSFAEFFRFLAASLSVYSMSQPGLEPKLNEVMASQIERHKKVLAFTAEPRKG